MISGDVLFVSMFRLVPEMMELESDDNQVQLESDGEDGDEEKRAYLS